MNFVIYANLLIFHLQNEKLFIKVKNNGKINKSHFNHNLFKTYICNDIYF